MRGRVVSLLTAVALVVTLLPVAIADELPARTLLGTADELWPQPIDVAGLVKPEFTVEPTVATEVLHSGTVRKIGYGRTSFVTIAETATGTYSSDGMASPHVRYPGIHRAAAGGDGPRPAGLKLWTGEAWLAVEGGGGSFVALNGFPGGDLLTTGAGSCAVLGNAIYC